MSCKGFACYSFREHFCNRFREPVTAPHAVSDRQGASHHTALSFSFAKKQGPLEVGRAVLHVSALR